VARVVVVGGAGAEALERLGGLAAVARLARQRHEVIWVEPNTPDPETPRMRADPASFTLPAVYRDLFAKTGRPLGSVVDLVPVDPARRFVLADGSVLDLPTANRAATLDAFGRAFGSASAYAWDAMITEAGVMWDGLRRTLAGPPDGAESSRSRPPSWKGRRGSLRAFARARLPDPRARAILEWYTSAAGADPVLAPAALAVLAYTEHAFGSWQVAGGLPALVDAIADRAVLRGASCHPGTITDIRTEGGRVVAVTLADGTTIATDLVVDATGSGISTPVRHSGRTEQQEQEIVAWLRSDGDAAELPVEIVELDASGRAAVVVRRPDLTGDPGGLTVSWPKPAGVRPADLPGLVHQGLADLVRLDVGLNASLVAVRTLATRSAATLASRTVAGGRALPRSPRRRRDLATWLVADPVVLAPGWFRVGTAARGSASIPYLGLSAARVAHECGTVPRAAVRDRDRRAADRPQWPS